MNKGSFQKPGRFSLLTAVLFASALFLASCGENGSKIPEGAETVVARYPVSVYGKKGSRERDDYVATLNKAEEVILLDIETLEGKKKEEQEYAKVKLSDGKTGYVENRHLAQEAVVITAKSLKIYKRPNITSGTGYGEEHIQPGLVAFIEDTDFENGEWFLISGSSGKGKYFKGWTTAGEGVTRDLKTVVSAVQLEKALEGLNKEDNSAAIEDLKSLASSAPSAIAKIAQSKLDEQEGNEVEVETDVEGTPDYSGEDHSGESSGSDSGQTDDAGSSAGSAGEVAQ